MVVVQVRCYEELNDCLPNAYRKTDFECAVPEPATVAGLLQQLAIPYSKVELILVNGQSATLDRELQDGERVSCYPVFERFDVTPLLKIRDRPLRDLCFNVDRSLTALGRQLQKAGFEVEFYTVDFNMVVSEQLRSSQCVTLTADPLIADHAVLTRLYRVKHQDLDEQFEEVVQSFQLNARRGRG